MPTSMTDADSVLVVDVGSVSTRAILFDIVDGRYRFLSEGTAPTTAGAPFHNVGEGVRSAIDALHQVTGRSMVGQDEQLIQPSNDEGAGVDGFTATMSIGAPLKLVLVGLLEDVSLESVRHLAMTTYSKVMQVISLTDRRKPEDRIDAILRLRPDLVIAAGGTDNGASQSILKLLETVGLACYLMPKEQRLEVLFTGNQALHDEIQTTMGGLANLHFAPNIRPTLDVEQLDAAQAEVARIYSRIRAQQIPGVEDLNRWSGGNLGPTATAFGRIIRFLSKTHATNKGVLGVDVGASATTVAAAFAGNLTLGVYPQFGLGEGLAELLDNVSLSDITRWLTLEIADETVREYLRNKSLYPSSLPVTPEELEIEQAVTRQVMQSAVKMASSGLPAQATGSGEGLLPWVEPILATGSVLTRAPSLAQSALMLLDGLQPTGATTIILDQNQIASALGAVAMLNPVLAVQVLDSNSFVHLGTVISPVGNARFGTPILRVKVSLESGEEKSLEIKQGALEVLHLPQGKLARLQLQPLHRYDVGMGAPGRGGSLRIVGGSLGVIIDARGRPLILPGDRGKRVDLLKKWLWSLGGQ
jgi:uncharacterized protein (TIGR01319 family)